MGLEPTIFRFEVGRLIRWASRPYVAIYVFRKSLSDARFGILIWHFFKKNLNFQYFVTIFVLTNIKNDLKTEL